METRQSAHRQTPQLRARDIVELFAICLPRRPRNEAEVLHQMQRRHAAANAISTTTVLGVPREPCSSYQRRTRPSIRTPLGLAENATEQRFKQ